MPGLSLGYDIRQALLNLFQGNSDSFPGLPSTNMVVRKLPKKNQKLDVLPILIIAPYRKIDWDPLGFEQQNGGINRTYYDEIAIVSANNSDFSDNETYDQWLEVAVRLAAQSDMSQVNPPIESVWRVQVLDNPVFDRSKLNDLYAYQSIVLSFDSQENRN